MVSSSPWTDRPSCHKLIRTTRPHVRFAAVIAVVGDRAGWQHDVRVVTDRDRVDVVTVGRGGKQVVEFGGADEPPAEADHDDVGVQPGGREEALAGDA